MSAHPTVHSSLKQAMSKAGDLAAPTAAGMGPSTVLQMAPYQGRILSQPEVLPVFQRQSVKSTSRLDEADADDILVSLTTSSLSTMTSLCLCPIINTDSGSASGNRFLIRQHERIRNFHSSSCRRGLVLPESFRGSVSRICKRKWS